MTTTNTTLTDNTGTAPAFAGAARAEHYIETPPPAPPDAAHPAPTIADRSAASAPLPPQIGDPFAELTQTPTADTGTAELVGIRAFLAGLGFPVGPSASQIAQRARDAGQRENERIVRQATWTRAVSILVANPKGGVGKTPTSLILGGVLASIRGGSVCVMEVADDPGALTFRSEGTPTLGIGDLITDLNHVHTAGHLAGYTAPQTSFASVLGTTTPRPPLTAENVTAVATVVDEFYAIRVMDSGNQHSSAAFNAAVETADILVIPVMNAGDAALEAATLLRTLTARGGTAAAIAQNAILIRSTDGRPENPDVTARVETLLDSTGIQHRFDIPYDPHIAERGQISINRLTPATYEAFTAAAAAVVRSLQATVR
ncbi:ParA family protein [Marisediminicola senii]|uniref:ParA family protein n=1 Tax=Marisediminicola senii TaxID=2711233 RepID=UPI0013EDB4E0|nr:ParA family protein [Marisediminicola senii]